MQVREIMSIGPECIQDDCTVAEAAKKMEELNIGALPVLSQHEIVGMVTDRDLVTRCVAEGKNPTQYKVADCMTKNVFSVNEHETLEHAAQIMAQHGVRRLIVVGDDERPIGLVNFDHLEKFSDEPEIIQKELRKIAERKAA